MLPDWIPTAPARSRTVVRSKPLLRNKWAAVCSSLPRALSGSVSCPASTMVCITRRAFCSSMLLSLTSGYVLGGNLGRGSQPSKRLGQSCDQSLQTKRLLGSLSPAIQRRTSHEQDGTHRLRQRLLGRHLHRRCAVGARRRAGLPGVRLPGGSHDVDLGRGKIG